MMGWGYHWVGALLWACIWGLGQDGGGGGYLALTTMSLSTLLSWEGGCWVLHEKMTVTSAAACRIHGLYFVGFIFTRLICSSWWSPCDCASSDSVDRSLADMNRRALMGRVGGAGGYGLACMTDATRVFVMCHCKVEDGRSVGGV